MLVKVFHNVHFSETPLKIFTRDLYTSRLFIVILILIRGRALLIIEICDFLIKPYAEVNYTQHVELVVTLCVYVEISKFIDPVSFFFRSSSFHVIFIENLSKHEMTNCNSFYGVISKYRLYPHISPS